MRANGAYIMIHNAVLEYRSTYNVDQLWRQTGQQSKQVMQKWTDMLSRRHGSYFDSMTPQGLLPLDNNGT